MSQTQASKQKPPVSIRPRPGQTELNWREWLMLIGIIVVSVVICSSLGRSIVDNLAKAAPTPTITPTVIKPTVTLIPTPTLPPTPTPTPAIPDTISVGVYVVVVQGVNFRKDANTTAQIIRTLGDGEVLEVTGGPQTGNNLTWWKVKDVNGVEGWAAQDYLKPTAPPQ
jgi:hypothetical protein